MIDLNNSTLIARNDIGERHPIFSIEFDSGLPLEFIPGQWTEIGLPRSADPESGPSSMDFVQDGIVRRAYSIASAPGARHTEFFFNAVEEGGLTPWLWNLQPGGRMYVNPQARGGFTLEGTPDDADIIAVATGTGISPFASMLRHYTDRKPWRRFLLIHGARHENLLGYHDLFHSIAAKDESIVYVPTVTRPGDSWAGLWGRVQTRLLDETVEKAGIRLNPERARIFLCGNSNMIQDMEDLLMKKGFRPRWEDADGNIHTEIYY